MGFWLLNYKPSRISCMNGYMKIQLVIHYLINPGQLNLNYVVNGNNNLQIGRFTGFFQDNISFKKNPAVYHASRGTFKLQYIHPPVFIFTPGGYFLETGK